MKTLILGAALAVGAATAASAATLNPLALYTFDSGIATDDSGNGNHGIAHAGTSLAVNGSRDGSNALMLTPSGGTSGIETAININRSAMPSMTMGGWVLATGNGNGVGGKFLSHDNGAYGRTIGLDVRGDSNGMDFTAFTGSGVVDADNSGSLIGQWIHMAVVYDGANSGLYIDGVLDTAFVDNTSTAPGLTQGLFIGTNNHFNEDFQGFVDDVFVFDSALSASEIAQIASVGFEEVAPVPLPAGLPMLLGGLAGLAALRRRRTRTA